MACILKRLFPDSRINRRPRRTPSALQLEQLESHETPSTGGLDLAFSADGRATAAFDVAGGLNDMARAVAVQPDGKIVAVGDVEFSNGDYDMGVARFNVDGTPDLNFGVNGRRTVPFDVGGNKEDRATAVAIDAAGRIVIGGYVQTGANGFDFAVARLNSDGKSYDTTFNGTGKQTIHFNLGSTNNDIANALALQPDGKIVLAGRADRTSDVDMVVARLNTDGTLDPTFSVDGKQIVFFDLGGLKTDEATGVAIHPDGKIVLGGSVIAANGNSDFGVFRLLSDGTPDSTFGVNGRQTVTFSTGNDVATGVAVQSDGRIVVAGAAPGLDGNLDMAVARLNYDGSSDSTFGPGGQRLIPFDKGGQNNDVANSVAIQPDGKIVVAGRVEFASDTDLGIARLNPNGSLDTTFSNDGQQSIAFDLGDTNYDLGNAVALSPDGIVVAGAADTTSGGFNFAVTRLVRDQWLVVSADRGGPPTVKVFTPTGTLLKSFSAFAPTFRGGVRVATGDITGDGVPDLFCAPGPGAKAVVKVFDGLTLTLIRQIPVYAPGFLGGVNLAVGGVLGGAPLLVTAPGPGGGQLVNIIDPSTGTVIKSIKAFGPGKTFGLRVATGDTTGTGTPEIIVTPQAGGPGVVRTFDAVSGTQLQEFQVYPAPYKGGLFLATGAINSSGKVDPVVGPGQGGTVKVLEGSTGNLLEEIAVGDPGYKLGARVGTINADGDSVADLILSPAAGTGSTVKVRSGAGTVLAAFNAYPPTMKARLFVLGAAR